ncbi:MAG TPA: F0F1 ATP synthase subunit B [Acidiferrobacterales bacterium]
MNINATLIGQTIAFIVFVWFCMRFIWPPVMHALEARKRNIADGLAAGEKGRHELTLAEKRATEILRETKQQATEILAQAEKRGAEIVEEAKQAAKTEAENILAAAKADIGREINAAREQLRARVTDLAVAGAARILKKEIDAQAHAKLLDDVVRQL